jgi:hypothetical protein
MKVTRDVVYDLLPSYFAGDASEDTRALIDEFFASDPEFGRMAERFRKLMTDRPPASAATEADRAKIVFDRSRARVKLRLGAAIWALGSLFAFAMAVVVTGPNGFGLRHPGIVIGVVFGGMALGTWLTSLSSHPENWLTAFTGEKGT